MSGLDSRNAEAEKLHGDLTGDRLTASRHSFPSLIWDGRLGNQGCFSLTTREELMQIPPTIMKTVVFLAVQRNSGFHVGGTGFLVSEPLPGTTIYSHYIITAAHVIQGIKERAIDGKVHLRANLTSGGVGMVSTNVNDWVVHDDPKIDLAAMPIAAGGEHLDHMYFGLGSIATDEVISKESIGPGTDLVFPGLFTRHIGTARNIPIARTGTLAALPDDPVLTPRGPMRAYLVEARSIRGLSGSPVFCVVGPIRVTYDNTTPIKYGNLTYYLLGVVHGHYDIEESNWDVCDSASTGQDSINMGIAIVVPAKEILTILDQQAFRDYRDQQRQRFAAQQQALLPKMDEREPMA